MDHISTPNIDSIGYAGVIFEDAYVTAPTCAPSRAGIMTGRVQNRYGFETQVMEFYPTNMVEYLSGKYFVNTGSFVMEAKPQFPSQYQVQKQGLPPTEINLAEALKTLNYTNGLVGKWHLGISKNHVPVNKPLFKWFLYGGLVNKFNLQGQYTFEGETEKFKASELNLHIYNLGARFGTQVDIGLINVDLSYTIGITNSFKGRLRTNSHGVLLSLGLAL